MASDGAETMSALQAGRSRRAVQQRRRRGRRSFVVVCDARAASELSPIAVVSASRPCLPTEGLSPGSLVQSGCDSGTQEVVLLSRAKRLSPVPVFFLRLRHHVFIKLKSNKPSYSNTVVGTLAIDGWAVTFDSEEGTGWGCSLPRPLLAVPTSYYSMWHYWSLKD